MSTFTSKSTRIQGEGNQYVFNVVRDATKPEIKAAVEQLFKVEVDEVKTVTMKGKTKRAGRNMGKRKDWKKAYVKLKEGHDIDFIGMAT